MDASEIEYIESRLDARHGRYPTPDELERYVAKAHRERNREIAGRFASLVDGLRTLAAEARRIAVACTAARLHKPRT